ncbi:MULTISPECIES: ROK family transcriptional regulator [Streptosporangium]|uniref:NBD/HSP70 family sugar kinase n=1 Tax=Streptosporangium brasiliense TaxID=47480 RepID=A0ABT9RF91_9ACTN|nr:ROK family protein [Streptosporangium brasiliense]MDP9867932.1 putative NBD/HSP70 family sugar kinase [Streptosporangium brasiliense]
MRVRGSDTSRLRRINMVTALRALRGHGAIGLTELASRAGLSRPTVEGLAEDLLASGWLAESPPETGQMGRPRRLFRFRAEAGHVLGVDVGSYSVRALVCDLEGQVMGRSVTRLTSQASRADRLDGVRSAARGALKDAGLEAGRLTAACVGTTGVVTREGVVKLSVALPEWTGVDLVAELGDDIGPVVLVENDCNLAALAERWMGVATGARDLVFVLSGVRTGAGLLIRGELYGGGRGMAGEIGALPLVGWHRAPSHLAGFSGLPAGTAAEEVAGLVFAAARQGDPAARWAVEQYAHDLAEGIAALVLTMDPDLVVIGGGVSRSGDVLLEPLRRHLDPLCLEPPELAVSTLGDQAVVLGAVRHALDHVDARLYDVDATLPEAQPC